LRWTASDGGAGTGMTDKELKRLHGQRATDGIDLRAAGGWGTRARSSASTAAAVPDTKREILETVTNRRVGFHAFVYKRP
jgi:hypothetical protein